MTSVLRGSGLSRHSTGEELAGLLRDQILRGELAPDEPMREAALASRYEVSRRTVREALSVLEHAGLVRHHRHKGARVTQFDEGDIHDLYRVRRTLETAAARGCAGASAERQDALAVAFDRLAEASRSGSAEAVVARDLQFHQAVVGLLDSPRVNQFFADIALEMRYALSILEASALPAKPKPGNARRLPGTQEPTGVRELPHSMRQPHGNAGRSPPNALWIT